MRSLILIMLLLAFNAEGLKRKAIKKTLYTSQRACDKARLADPNADCSVVDFQLDKLFSDADTDKTLYFLVSEVPVRSVDISPVASGTGTFPTSWGARGISRESGAVAGTFPSEIQDDIVIITNSRIGFSSTTAKRVSKIAIGPEGGLQTEYAVPLLARNSLLGGRTVIYQAITGGLPSTGDWEDLVIFFTDGTKMPVGGPSVHKRISYSDISGGGGTTYLGSSQAAVFQVPTLASTALMVTTANTPVFHNISAFTGAGISGVLTQSAVSNVGRITVATAGYVNIVVEDEIRLISSTAGGSGNSGELVVVLTQYSSADTDLRSWVFEHSIQDPITSAINMPFSLVSGLTPVSAGDYFTLNLAFNSTNASTLTFSLPADNPGLDERLEVFYWPITSIVPAGPRGPPGAAGPAGPGVPAGGTAGQILTKSSATDYATEWSDASGGGKSLIAFTSLPTDLSPFANGEVIRVQTSATSGQWYEILGADAGELHSFQTVFEADSANPAQASWAVGTDLNYGYSSFGDIFGELRTADGGQPFTASNTPIMRMEIEQEVATITQRNPQGDQDYTFNTTYTLLIRKTDLATAPATVYARYYTGPPGVANQVATVEFMRGTDNPAHTYHTYIDRNGADISEADLLSIKYFNLFTSNPSTGDQTSNPLELHEPKSANTRTIDPPFSSGVSFPTNPSAGDLFIFTEDVQSGLDWAGPDYVAQRVITDFEIKTLLRTNEELYLNGRLSDPEQLSTGSSSPTIPGIRAFYFFNNTLYIDIPADQAPSGLPVSHPTNGLSAVRLRLGDAFDMTFNVDLPGASTTIGSRDYWRYAIPITHTNASNTWTVNFYFGPRVAGQRTTNPLSVTLPATGVLTSANEGDVARYDGSVWRKITLGVENWAIRGHTEKIPFNKLSNLDDIISETRTTNPDTLTNLAITGSIGARSNMGMAGDATSGIIFGGRNQTIRFNDFKKYEVSGNGVTVTNLTVTGSIGARSSLGMVGDVTSGIIFGGWDGNSLGDFKKYEVSGNGVTVTNLTVTGTIRSRYSPGMVGNATSGIIFGGTHYDSGNDDDIALNDFYKYEVSGNTVTVTSLTVTGTINVRSDIGMVGDTTSGVIFGGYNANNGVYYDDFKKYEVSGNTVTVTNLDVTGDNIRPRYWPGMVGDTTSGVIFGGYDANFRVSQNDFYRYEISGNSVNVTSITPTGSSISARTRIGMVGNATSGIIFGGRVWPTHFGDFYRFNSAIDRVDATLKPIAISPLVPQQFRSDATTNTTRFQPRCFEVGTAAQITALTKVENCIYMSEKASQ